MAIQLTLPPDIEAVVEKRLATGAYADVEDVLRHALDLMIEADEEEPLTEEDLAHIEEGYQQAMRGELIDGEQAFREIAEANRQWLKERQRG